MVGFEFLDVENEAVFGPLEVRFAERPEGRHGSLAHGLLDGLPVALGFPLPLIQLGA